MKAKNRSVARLSGLVCVGLMVVSGCSSDRDGVVSSEASGVVVGDEDGSPDITEEESEAIERGLSRADLELSASVVSVVDGSATVEVTIRSPASMNGVGSPSVIVVASDGVTIPASDERCETVDGETICKLADSIRSGSAGPNGVGLTDQFAFGVEAGSEAPTVTLTAVSRDNPLDNDPDPSNNVVLLDLVAG